MEKKHTHSLLVYGFLILTMVLFMVFSIYFTTFQRWIYVKEMERTFGWERWNEAEYRENLNVILEYLADHKGESDIGEGYSKREILHMEDVKLLYTLARYVLGIGGFIWCILLLCLLYHIKMNFLFQRLWILYVLPLVLGFFAYIGFHQFFELFHKILFRNDFWLLDAEAKLIQMFPLEIFIKLSQAIFGIYFLMVIILTVIVAMKTKTERKKYGNCKAN
ncbi:MAG: TIGR01906 family membrane protein [Tissierellia bacterium]|nr:TIGR01906 family membrane protein [Tissierellia bacterium]